MPESVSVLDQPISVTFFTSAGATEKREERTSMRNLASVIRNTSRARKEWLPWLKLARFGDNKTENDSYRHNKNVIAVSGVEADYDGEKIPVASAVSLLEQQGVAALVYTSPSHAPEKPHWRVLCPLSAEVSPEARAQLLGRLNGLFRGAFAPESFVLSQSYYYGCVDRNAAHDVHLIDGAPLDQHDDLDEVWQGPPEKPPAPERAPSEATADPLDIAGALAAIPNGGKPDWEFWNRIGMAAWAASGGSPEGFAAWLAWSKRNPCHSAPACGERWRHYSVSPPNKIGAGTLIYLAKQARDGWRKPTSAARQRGAAAERPPGPEPDNEPDLGEPPARSSVPEIEAPGHDRPRLVVRRGELDLLATRAEEVLAESGQPVFRRGVSLVRPAAWEVAAAGGRTTLTAGIREVSQSGLMDVLSQAATWLRWDARAKAEVPIDPPSQVAAVILSRAGFWRSFRPLAAVSTTPTLRRDCSVVSAPGYDAVTQTYLVADPSCIVPGLDRVPTRADAEAGLALLRCLLEEFPLVGPVDEAVALSALISPVCRGALGSVPLHAFDAPVAGSGKSYLADLVSAVAAGRRCPVVAASGDQKETEARLTGVLLAGYPIVSLDNLSNAIGGDLLCQATSQPTVRLRPLGTSEMTEIDVVSCIYATGNNVTIAGDMTRRALVARLDPQLERPELRQFSADPVTAVLADRGQYVGACLDIVRAYCAAGRPARLPALASYGEWSLLVRSALVWLGCADPARAMDAARESDPINSALACVLIAWRDCYGDAERSAGQVASDLSSFDPRDSALGALRSSLATVADRAGVITALRLGQWLARHHDRVSGGLRIARRIDRHSKVPLWRAV